MRRPPEAGDPGSDAGEGIGARGGSQPHGRGRGVLFVVGVQREDPVHRPAQDRIDHVVGRRHREAHVQEVRGVVEVVARIDEGLAHVILEGPGNDGRHLGDHPDRRHLALPGVVDVGRVVVEGRHRPHDAADHRHRMRVPPEAAEEIRHLLVQHGVVGDAGFEILHLLRGRQFAVEQEIGDLEEMRLRGQLLDGISAVEQLALVAINIGDRALAGPGGGIAGIEGEDAALRIEPADVDDVRTDGSVIDREVERLVSDRQFCGFM